jgi:hypothetical protein
MCFFTCGWFSPVSSPVGVSAVIFSKSVGPASSSDFYQERLEIFDTFLGLQFLDLDLFLLVEVFVISHLGHLLIGLESFRSFNNNFFI